MHSWLTRCSIGLTSAAVIGATLLLPSTAQAGGTEIEATPPATSISADDSATTEPVSDEVEVEQTAIDVESAPDRDEPDEAEPSDEPSDEPGDEPGVQRETVDPFRMAGVTWSADSDVTDVSVRVQVRTNGAWGDWQDLEIEDVEEGGRPGTAPLWTDAPADAIAVDVKAASGTPEDVRITTIDPGRDEVVAPVTNAVYNPASGSITESASDGTPSVVPMPSIITRKQWKAGSGTSCSAPITRPKALGVVIHHTAGSNTYKKSESAGIVRSYQTYHVKGHGWCDIGYNFLVDRFGQIFEGRKGGMTNQVRAAHSGVDAVNQYATGVSMMGHFDYVRPSAAQQAAVVKLVGWRLKFFGANPKGTYKAGGRTYQVINGHRDVKATACPGKYGYAWLGAVGGLRDRVATYVSKAGSAAGAPSGNTFATPTNVKVTTSTTTATVTWNTIAGAPGYRILVSPTGSTAGAKYYRSTTGSVTIRGLDSATTSVFRVAVYDNSTKKRMSRWTPRPYTVGTTATFQPPTGITVTKRAAKGLRLAWNAVAEAPGYRVQLVPVGQTKPKRYVQTYTNSVGIGKLTKGTRYQIRVSVVNPATKVRHSAYTAAPYPTGATKGMPASNPAPTTPAVIGAPTNVKVTTGTTTARVTWSRVAGAPGYRILVSPTGSTKNAKYYRSTGTSVNIRGLDARRSLVFRVAAYDHATKKRLGKWSQRPFTTGRTKTFQPVTGIKVTKRAAKGLRFSWKAQAGAPGYRVQVVPVGKTKPKRYTMTTTNSAGVGKLTKGTRYRVRVAVVNPATKERLGPYTKAPFPTGATMGMGGSTPVSAKNTVAPSGGSITFKGHGYGHGIGMSQYGAEGGARAGKKYAAILRKYYPGTTISDRSATIRVLISADTSHSVHVKHKSGLGLRTLGNNKVLALPARVDGRKVSDWSVDRAASNSSRNELSYKSGSRWYVHRNFPADAQFEGPTSISLVMPNGKTQAFRGALRSTKPTSTTRDTVNVLNLEDYVRGVVAREMPSSWSMEALKAQSVAARTFGSRYLGSPRYYDICDTVSCQVYGGVAAETSRTNQAINATKGKILTYGGTPALTQFSSSSGGFTNAGSMPYLKPVADPWDGWSGNKNHAWTQKVSAATIQAKYPVGKLQSLSITKRNGHGAQGGRVVSMTVKGAKGSRTITGVDARWAFGLKSDWFGF